MRRGKELYQPSETSVSFNLLAGGVGDSSDRFRLSIING